MLQLAKLSVSDNPNTEKVNVDGRMFSKMKDGRLFLIAFLTSLTNPFATYKRRLVAQVFDSLGRPTWNINLDGFKNGMQIPGEIVTEDVFPYDVKSVNTDGEEVIRKVSKYSCAVIEGESKASLFHNQGHRLLIGQEVNGEPIFEPESVLPPRYRNGSTTPHTEETGAPIGHELINS